MELTNLSYLGRPLYKDYDHETGIVILFYRTEDGYWMPLSRERNKEIYDDVDIS